MAATVEALYVINADGGSATFSAGTVNAGNGGIAVQTLRWVPQVDTTRSPRGSLDGLEPAFAYVHGMTIEAVGLIVGTDASDYWGRRAELAKAVLPGTGSQDSKNHGTVYATFAGTAVYAGVTAATWDAPLDLTGPHETPYTIGWLNPDGYWRLVSSDAAVRL